MNVGGYVIVTDEQRKALEERISKRIPMTNNEKIVVNIEGFTKVLLIRQTGRGRKYEWISTKTVNPNL